MTLRIHTSTATMRAPKVGDKLISGAGLIWTVGQVDDGNVVLTHPLADEAWAIGHDDFVELCQRGMFDPFGDTMRTEGRALRVNAR